MKILTLLSFILLVAFNSYGGEQKYTKNYYYKGMKNSLIQWDKIDSIDFLDYDLWSQDTKLRDKWPQWEKTIREKRRRETVGKVIHCVGDCKNYRGVGFYNTQFRSSILEGDEIHTSFDSYAWIFLFDGTIVRLSPSSSVTFREINFGLEETFIHARINSGNVLWLSRSQSKYIPTNDRETDVIFFPLQFYEAMPISEKIEYDEDSLMNLLEENHTVKKQYVRLNKLIEDNNKYFKKRNSYSFLVSPNGTVEGRNINVEFISLIGNRSYVKSRGQEKLGIENELEDGKVKFSFRGFENKKTKILDNDEWYEIDQKGRFINKFDKEKRFVVGEFITKRIPTILVARELLLKEYSKFSNYIGNAELLAKTYNYRQWGSFSNELSDMSMRLTYLKEYTRRMETTTLLTSERLREKMLARNEPSDDMQYSAKFFNLALVNFLRSKNSSAEVRSDREVLNSTTKKYWKVINDIK